MIEVDTGLAVGTLKPKVAFGGGQGLTALFGRSGCDKSVTLNLIAGLLKPDEGLIRLDGNALVDAAQKIFLPPHQHRIGVVSQDSNLFPHFSIRAILSGTVSSIENKGLFARVLVTLEGRDLLAVTVTRQAVEDMNLQNGRKVFCPHQISQYR